MDSWTERNFDDLCWHDCHVHAWGVTEAEHGHATLTLDIDFITAWEQPGDGTLAFQVAPATLTFFDVFEFVFSVDYTGFAVAPFSMQGIERELRGNAAGHRDYLYRIVIDHPPRGMMRFRGDRFRQVLRAPPTRTRSQSLDHRARLPLIGGAESGAGADERRSVVRGPAPPKSARQPFPFHAPLPLASRTGAPTWPSLRPDPLGATGMDHRVRSVVGTHCVLVVARLS